MAKNLIRVGISHGDINGIGYEVILKTFADLRILELCTPIIYGSSKMAGYHRKAMGLPQVNFNNISTAEQAGDNRVNFINCVDDTLSVALGTSSHEAGKAALQSLQCAADDLARGKIDVLVTAPINKNNIHSDEFPFPGHTEYLEKRFAKEGEKSLMILVNDNIRVALVTGHLPINEIAKNITQEVILEKVKIFNHSLIKDFGIVCPRIAVLALNPHAGDEGLLGSEESFIINPAIKQANEEGLMVFGPYAADGFFGARLYDKFDGILAMYHDQGLAPFKALCMDDGINFTAGLPVIRTSPAHGTAYDIAGKGIASESSFRQAIYSAIDIYRNRILFEEATANPLRCLYHDRGKDNVKLDLTSDEE